MSDQHLKQLRQQYHLRMVGDNLYVWDVFSLIRQSEGLPVQEVSLDTVTEVDEEYWYEVGGAKPDVPKHY